MEAFNIKVNPSNLVRDIVVSLQNNTFEDPSEGSAFFEKCKDLIIVEKKPLAAVKECIARTPEALATQDFAFVSSFYSALLAYMDKSCPPQIKPKFLANITSEILKSTDNYSFALAVLTHIYTLFFANQELQSIVFADSIVPLLKKAQEAGIPLKNFLEVSGEESAVLSKNCPEAFAEFSKM